nr:sulfate/thiosulfate ABC transporter permease CysW [Shewanella shenzhenensis]
MQVHPSATAEPALVRRVLTGIALLFIVGTLVLPLLMVLYEAFRSGWSVYQASITEADALAAIKLTVLVAVIVVPLNLLCG